MPTIDSPVILKFLFTGAEMIVTSKYSFPSLYSSIVIPIAFFFFSNIYLFGSARSQVRHIGPLVAVHGSKSGPPALGTWGLRHWTTREAPH